MVLFGEAIDPWAYRSISVDFTEEIDGLVQFSETVSAAVERRDELRRQLDDAQAEVDRLVAEFNAKVDRPHASGGRSVTGQVRAMFEARPTEEMRAADLLELGVRGRPDQVHGALTWLARPRGCQERVAAGLYRLRRPETEDGAPPSFMLL